MHVTVTCIAALWGYDAWYIHSIARLKVVNEEIILQRTNLSLEACPSQG